MIKYKQIKHWNQSARVTNREKGSYNNTLDLSGIDNILSNFVTRVYYTKSLTGNSVWGDIFGDISYTATTQLNSSEMFYAYSSTGNGYDSAGVGVNIVDWFGFSVYASENMGIGGTMSFTPWFSFGGSISLREGISLCAGITIGNTTHDLSVNIGWGTVAGVALAVGISMIPVPGMRVVSLLVALLSLFA